jgi:predicted RNA-binding Zn-ribbon protein involved in translation (DUF1610 family)
MSAIEDREFVQATGQARGPVSASDLARLRPLLGERTIPVKLRIQAAARALASLPDTRESVRIIAKPLTAGLSPLRRLERLRQLQHQLETHVSLDALIERREARLKMDCPRCGRRYPRETMVRHLWHEHGLILEDGKVRSPRRTVRELTDEHAASHDTTVLDRTSLVADEAAIRAWVAASDPPGEDVAPLLAAAEENGCGLCSECFAEREPPVPPLPPPMARSQDRLAADGDTIQIHGRDWFPTLTVSTAAKFIHFGPEGSIGPRGLATLAAAFLLMIAFAITVFGSREWAAPGVIVRFLLCAAAVYGLIRALRVSTRRSEDRLVDAAWMHLVPVRLAGNHSSRSLTRVCRSSLGRGDPAERAALVKEVLERAAAEGDLQLLAAASILQASDRARMGHDHASAVAAPIAEAIRGERSTAFAELAAECYLASEPPPPAPERARIRVLLLEAAFEAGFSPRDLNELWIAAPRLRALMGVEPLHRLALLHGVAKMQPDRGWERIARAESVFELCRSAPNIGGRLLAEFPDLLLCHRPDPDTEAQLGPVLICTRGIAVGGRMLADPQTEVSLEKAGGRIELVFGPHRFPLERQPIGDLPGVIREWLRFRAWALLPLLDNYLLAGSPAITARVLKPFRTRCPQCGTSATILRTDPHT